MCVPTCERAAALNTTAACHKGLEHRRCHWQQITDLAEHFMRPEREEKNQFLQICL